MTYRLRSLVAIVAVGGALLAGCGSSSSSSSSTSAAPAASTSTSSSGGSTSTGAAASTSTGAAASTSTGSSGGAAVADNPAVKAAVAQCKTAINSAPQLSAASKSKLDGLCDKAASGKLTDLKSVTYEVCKQVIKDSLPAAQQQTALASCPKP
jgi:hypothetical protein